MRLTNSLKISLALIVLLVLCVYPVLAEYSQDTFDLTSGMALGISLGDANPHDACAYYGKYDLNSYSVTGFDSSWNSLHNVNNNYLMSTSSDWCVSGIVACSLTEGGVQNGQAVVYRKYKADNPNNFNAVIYQDHTISYVGETVTFSSDSLGDPTAAWWVVDSGDPINGFGFSDEFSIGTHTIDLYITKGEIGDHAHSFLNVISGLPTASFIGTPLTGSVPYTVDLNDQSTVPDGAPAISMYQWNVKKPSGVYVSGYGSALTTFEVTADQLGYYDVSLTVVNSAGSDTKHTEQYFNAGMGGLTPTPTPTLNETPVVTYSTFAPLPTGVIFVVNKTEYKESIEDSIIGNFTAPYLDAVDSLGESVELLGMGFVNFTTMPIGIVTPEVVSIVDIFNDITIGYATNARYLLVAVTMTISSIPPSVQGLVTYCLLCDFIVVVLRGRYGNA